MDYQSSVMWQNTSGLTLADFQDLDGRGVTQLCLLGLMGRTAAFRIFV